MTSPVYGFRNHIESHQTPKGRCGNERDHDARPPALTSSSNSVYRWNSCLREHGGIGDSGKINERPGLKCPDCGRPCDTPDQAACPRCGSTEPCWE